MGHSQLVKTNLNVGHLAGSWLAVHSITDPPPKLLSAIEAMGEWDAAKDACERMGAYRALRNLAHWRKRAQTGEAYSAPAIHQHDREVWLDDIRLGTMLRLFRSVTPQEAQARIAYETFLVRFLTYLEHKAGILALDLTEADATIFVPEEDPDPNIPNIPKLWQEFVEEAFSAEAMRQTLVLLLNSVKLAERGFSVPVVPIVSEGQANALVAYVYATARDIRRRLSDYERKIAAGDKDAKTLQQKLETQQTNYGEALATMDSLMKDWEQRDAKRMRKVRELASGYSVEATRQLKSTRAIVAKFAGYAKELLELSPEHYLVIPPLLTVDPPFLAPRAPSDATGQLCYACGRVLPSPKRGTKTPIYTANKFILQAPSQTLQGYFAQTEPVVCNICAALAVVCPIKQADDALVVSLRTQATDGGKMWSLLTNTGYLYEQRLRAYTTGEMNVTAGRYLLMAAKEQGPSGKLLRAQIGGYEYALLKVASLLPTDVLEHFGAETFQGTDARELPQRHLVALHYLIEVFGIELWALREDKQTYGAVSDAIRYVERDALNHAIYRLFEKLRRKARYSEVDLALLEDSREAFAKGLDSMTEMNGANNNARRFRDIAGLTGALYALIDFSGRIMRQGGMSDDDRTRELKKLIEDVGNPNHFTYGVSDHSKGQAAQLWRSQQTWFIYGETKKLLREVGVDVDERETINQNGQPLLQVQFDDVDAIYAYLFERRYPTVREQRDLTYELKLSLYSRFPYLRPADKQGVAGS